MNNYNYFGVMLDMSRNAVMKVSEVKHLMDIVKKMGYNAVELYTEDTYEIEGEPFFGYMRGRYTADEIKEMNAYANSIGIELIPCVQTLAHFTTLVRHSTYSSIVDTADILLIDEEKTYELIDKIFKTLSQNFTSRKVNIGMDEAHMVGLGKYLDKHGYQNRYEILLRHLNRVVEIAKKYGFSVHMWSDMFFRLALNGEYYKEGGVDLPDEVVKAIPKEVEIVYWNYYSTTRQRYDDMLKSHKKVSDNVWFAGGASGWYGFAPFNQHTLDTMSCAMQSVKDHKIKNVLITLWGDDGKECSFYALLPSLYAVRQFADGNFDMDDISSKFKQLFGLDFYDFMKLDLPNKTPRKIFDHTGEKEVINNGCKSLLYADPFMGAMDKMVEQEGIVDYKAIADEIKNAGKNMGEFSYLFDNLSALCEVLKYKMDLGVRTRKAYKDNNKTALSQIVNDYDNTFVALEKFHKEFSKLWHKENKGFGFEVQDIRLGGLMQRLKTCKQRLIDFIDGKIDRIEELDEEVLCENPDAYFLSNRHWRISTFNTLV